MQKTDILQIRLNKEQKDLFKYDKCDKYDYLIAAGCGALGGLVDIFLVGAPGDSKLQSWTDEQVNKAVQAFAKIFGWDGGSAKRPTKSAIGKLETRFPVNYDQRHSGDVGKAFSMSAKNHHLKSLAHSPDIIGLFFSLLNQFTSTSAFLDNGKLIFVPTEKYELRGNCFVSKLFFGTVNWLGHIMSDVAGASGAVGRGSGIAIPFFELFQLCNFGKFSVGKDKNTLATVATKVFENGYDSRFGLTMSIPVILSELLIKLFWALKKHYTSNLTIAECIPTDDHGDLRIMLIVGEATLCVFDAVDAAIRSGGNWVNFFLRMNIIAWYRLITLALKEICIRLGLSSPLQKQLNAFIVIDKVFAEYLEQLKQIDIEKYEQETEQFIKIARTIEVIMSLEELNSVLHNKYEELGLPLPYEGEFDDFMKDQTTRLVFK